MEKLHKMLHYILWGCLKELQNARHSLRCWINSRSESGKTSSGYIARCNSKQAVTSPWAAKRA